MAATAESLQRQVEALQACCPVLCPAIVPNGFDTQDLLDLMQHAGRESTHAFEELLDVAGREASACCVCGADGSPSTSSSDDQEEDLDTALFFTVISGIDFKSRTIALQRAGFACKQCRALRSTCRMVRFAALRVGGIGGVDSSLEEANQERLLTLAAHLATLNRAPDSIQANPEAMTVWLQELYCRAYALQVVASNLGGWRAVGPDGQPLSLARGKDVVAAAKLLLGAGARSQRAKGEQKQKDGGKKQSHEAKPNGGAAKPAAAAAAKPSKPQEQQRQQRRSKDEQEECQPAAKKPKKAGAVPAGPVAADPGVGTPNRQKTGKAAAAQGQGASGKQPVKVVPAAATAGPGGGKQDASAALAAPRSCEQPPAHRKDKKRPAAVVEDEGKGAGAGGAGSKQAPGGTMKGGDAVRAQAKKAAAGTEAKASEGKGAGAKGPGGNAGSTAARGEGAAKPGKKAKLAKK